LIILNAGLAIGVLDTRMFTIMVIMALVTTAMAGPLLPRRQVSRLDDDVVPDAAPTPHAERAVSRQSRR
jgi:hypothetical protein